MASQPIQDMVKTLYQAVDSLDVAALAPFLANDVTFQLGNFPAIHGKEPALEANDGFFKTIASMRHTIDGIWAQGPTVICNGNVTYTRLDGTELTIPFATILFLANDKITTYQVYADVSPL